MLYGYATAALCGFVLTAIPNWTGRLPVSGLPLLGMVILWTAGRILIVLPSTAGNPISIVIDCLFLPTLAFVVSREVAIGRSWQNLRIAVGISGLAALNVAFHFAVAQGWDVTQVLRGTVALFLVLVATVGGRIIPSFTRNYLAKRGSQKLPRSLGKVDHIAIVTALVAGAGWTIAPEGALTAVLCGIAAFSNAVRLAGWRGTQTTREPLLLVLHVAYAFIPIGFICAAGAALDMISPPSALHVMTAGVIGLSTMAVMTPATRGHTGRAPAASWSTTVAYSSLFLSAILRPLAEGLANFYHPILVLSGAAWIAAFAIFLTEHVPMLIGRVAAKSAVGKFA